MFATDTMSIDAAKPVPGGLSVQQLEAFLSDMRNAPAWRQRSDLECNYYDGNQHTPDDIQKAAERGLPVVTINLVAPTIDLIIGMEARTRTDWVVKADGSAEGLTTKQADGLSAKLNEAERNTHADQACADAYASQIKAGIGWVEVAKSQNPFEYPFRVCAVDRREIWWDMRAKDRLLKDARWLVRRKWNDLDAVLTLVPEHMHEHVKAAVNNPSGWDMQSFQAQFPMLQDGLFSRDWLSDSSEWCDSERQRVCAYEVWYRVWHKGLVIKFGDGRVAEYDKKNSEHVAAVGIGAASLQWAAYHKMRLSWWVGPFRLFDVPTPYGHNEFPYVPFWGKMEDETRTPYGLIRAMKSLQDEVNARRAQMMWQLSARRVIVEDDAVDDHKALADEVNRPDAYIKLAKNRRQRANLPGIVIEDHAGLNSQQFQVYQDAKNSLPQTSGVHGTMLGDPGTGTEAGVAIDQLIQQGMTVLAGINSNYRFSRTEVGRKLLHLVMEGMAGKESRVTLPDTAPSMAKSVTFNKRVPTPDGGFRIENDTTRMLWRVALGEVPQSPTYQQQRMKEIVEYAKSLPPELQGLFADLVIMASDLPNKEQIAERIRKQLGIQKEIDPETASQEELAEAAAQQAAAEEQAQLQKLAQQIELEQGAAKASTDRAKAGKLIADTEQSYANTGLVRAQTIEALLGTNLNAGGPPKKPGEGGESAPAPKPKAPSPQEISKAAGQGLQLEQPMHDDRLTLGAEMSSF